MCPWHAEITVLVYEIGVRFNHMLRYSQPYVYVIQLTQTQRNTSLEMLQLEFVL